MATRPPTIVAANAWAQMYSASESSHIEPAADRMLLLGGKSRNHPL